MVLIELILQFLLLVTDAACLRKDACMRKNWGGGLKRTNLKEFLLWGRV